MKMFSFKILAFVFLLLGSLGSSEPGAPLRSSVAVVDDGVLARGGTSLRPRASTILKVPRVLKKKKKQKKQKVPKAAANSLKGGKKAKSAVTPQPSSQPSSWLWSAKDPA